jgi:hypothetical protein
MALFVFFGLSHIDKVIFLLAFLTQKLPNFFSRPCRYRFKIIKNTHFFPLVKFYSTKDEMVNKKLRRYGDRVMGRSGETEIGSLNCLTKSTI